MADNNDNNGIGTFLGIGLFVYGLYKLLSLNGNDSSCKFASPSKKYLTLGLIEDVVNSSFRSLSDFDIPDMIYYYALPDVFTGKIKGDIYNRMMFDRLSEVHKRILTLEGEYEGYYPPYDENLIFDLISYIKNDCYKQIKATKFFANLKGEILKRVPGFGVAGKFLNAKMEYHLITSINKSLTEYFTYLYVYGKDNQEAKSALMKKYVESFNHYADNATEGLASRIGSIFRDR